MSRSGWRYVFAAVGLAAFATASHGTESQPGSSDVAHEAGEHQSNTPNDPLASAIRELPSPYPNEDRCDDTEAANGPDLCAQWVAANAAKRSSDLAWWSVLWTVLSFGGLLATVVGTLWAAWAATRAAVAAEAAVAVSDKNTRIQIKPYIFSGKATAHIGDSGDIHVRLDVMNGGGTPAILRSFSFAHLIRYENGFMLVMRKQVEANAIVGPHNKIKHTFDINMDETSEDANKIGPFKLFIDFSMEFTDDFGDNGSIFTPMKSDQYIGKSKQVLTVRHIKKQKDDEIDSRPLPTQFRFEPDSPDHASALPLEAGASSS